MNDAVILYSLFECEGDAKEVARALVEEGLVGCANIGAGVTSIYCWHGRLEEAREVPVFFKLAPENLDRAKARLADLHSYDEPAILHWEAGSSAGYAAWLRA